MPRGVQDLPLDRTHRDLLTIRQEFIRGYRRHKVFRGDSQKGPLLRHMFIESEVRLVQEHAGVGLLLQFGGGADMIDVGVGVNDLGHGEAVLVQTLDDILHLIARIDDDRFLGLRISQNDAVALEASYRKYVEYLLHITFVIRKRW